MFVNIFLVVVAWSLDFSDAFKCGYNKIAVQNGLKYSGKHDVSKVHRFSYARTTVSSTVLKLSPLSDISVGLYDAQLWFSHLAETQFTTITPLSLGILFTAGLLTSFSPCAMGLIPLTLAYLGGSSDKEDVGELGQAALYAIGLALTLSAFGLSAAFLGQVYGTAASGTFLGEAPALLSAVLSLVMGLNLLEILELNFPSLDLGDFGSFPAPVRALLLGGSSALIASPCSSPVLASLLAAVASTHNPSLGAALLFTYSLGYATPVVVAGSMSGSFRMWMASKGAQWVNGVLASLLIAYGTYSSLDPLLSTATVINSHCYQQPTMDDHHIDAFLPKKADSNGIFYALTLMDINATLLNFELRIYKSTPQRALNPLRKDVYSCHLSPYKVCFRAVARKKFTQFISDAFTSISPLLHSYGWTLHDMEQSSTWFYQRPFMTGLLGSSWSGYGLMM
eukprot:gene5509-11104_t